MKIAFIIDSLRRHGTQRFLAHLARGLQNLGYAQTVIGLNDPTDPEIAQTLSASGVAIKYIGRRAFLLGGIGWWRLVGLLRALRADVVVTMLDFADTLGRPAARLAGAAALVSSIRARNLAKPQWQRWLDRISVGWAQKIVVNSAHVAEYVVKEEGVVRSQIVVIPNGVDDLRARSRSLRDHYRAQLQIASDTILIGGVGRLEPQKNFSLFLRVCAALPAHRPWKAVVIGEGREADRLKQTAGDLGLTDRVRWLGERNDVEGFLAAMDVFVHTADFEGMPNAIMEAMASGLPVVASAVDGNLELLRDGATGYLAPPGDAEIFTRRICEIMENSNLARQLGENAHRDVLEQFGLPAMIDAYHRLFLSLTKTE